ncbi:hypothetical protein SDC9_161612 [bioreactor metagenome]|uniref:Uncharacterized protein n=1 Tax=bioreactor metagenome TaxID=1076179 RepID=A0A645FKU7_9ZZZZ
MIRVAKRNGSAGGNQSDLRLGDVLNGRIGINAVEFRHRIFGNELFALHLLNQHVNGPLGTSFRNKLIDTDSLGEESIGFRVQFCAGNILLCELYNCGKSFSHTGSGVRSLNDVYLLAEYVNTRVFFVHGGKGFHLELRFDIGCNGGRSHTITSGIEGRSADHEIRIE